MENKKGTATNREGLGSTYAGTQTPDPHAPDGYQSPQKSANKQLESKREKKESLEVKQKDLPEQKPLGSEYEEDDSYGKKPPASKKNKKENIDKEEGEGSPVR